MAVILCIFICILFAILTFSKEKRILNPVFIFCCIWGVIICLSSLELFGLYPTSDYTYWMMFIGILLFCIGYFVQRILFKGYTLRFRLGGTIIGTNYENKYVVRYQLVLILATMACLYYSFQLLKVLPYLFSDNGMVIIRELASDSTSILRANRSPIENMLNTLIFVPISFALPAVASIDFWLGDKKKNLLIITIIIVLLRVITEGGRASLMYFCIHFIVGYIFAQKKKKTSPKVYVKKLMKKNKYITLLIVITIGVIVFGITISRSGVNPLRTIYLYFAMQPYMFETWAAEVNSSGLMSYGIAATNGFWFALMYLIKNFLGLSEYPVFWEEINFIISQTDLEWIMISSEIIRANAYVSLFWFFYLDGRIVGIIVGMFVYGLITGQTFSNALNHPSPRSVCVYSCILQGIIFSFVRMQFADISYAVAFIYILFIVYKPVVKEKEELFIE